MTDKKLEQHFIDLAKKYSLAHRIDLIDDVFRYFAITPYLDYHKNHRKNTENYIQEGYHNDQHDYRVCMAAFEIGLASNLEHDKIREVVLAALFHDFHHNQKSVSTGDGVNIDVAKYQWMKATEEVDKIKPLDTYDLTKKEIDKIIILIGHTEYPRRPVVTKSIQSKILCDADIMGLYGLPVEDRMAQIYGLMLERYGRASSIYHNRKLFVAQQEQFITGHRWYTRHARLKALTLNYIQLHRDAVKALDRLPTKP